MRTTSARRMSSTGPGRSSARRPSHRRRKPTRSRMGGVTYCSAHFSTGGKGWDDPKREWQPKQAAMLMEKADQSGYRPVFGGDLNVSPPARGFSALTPMYDRYQECDEKNGVYDGDDTKDGEKIDYIFSPYTFAACSVQTYVGLSDHYSIHGAVQLPPK
ncbi:endonuclease/exonuclease/phosphatase family protein [Streptomyces sp. NPDC087218]|uniref:endonuclease/exonuclease/phosphatase family protein n=1 Tax=Streptomyces sp. NPDC087218 TaxID=3365769 RepID=UPI0037F5BF56